VLGRGVAKTYAEIWRWRELAGRLNQRVNGCLNGSGEKMRQDPVCMTEIDETEAHNQGLSSEYQGKRYYFCCDQCKEDFDRDPESYMTQLGTFDQADEMRPDDYP
jgi:YHS domain-containing protein